MLASAGHSVARGAGLALPQPLLCGCLLPGAGRLGLRSGSRQHRLKGDGDSQRHVEGLSMCARATCSDLSTYSLEAPTNLALLERCAQQAVLHLDEAPCLHLMAPGVGAEFARQTVPESILSAPQMWKSTGEHVAHEKPELMILVHRVPEEPCPKTCWKLQMEVSRAEHPAAEMSDSLQVWSQTRFKKDIVAGKVGECCEEDEGSHPQHETAVATDCTSERGKALHQDITFWGMVIQSRKNAAMEGCYLLKTVRNIDPTGCTCTHFSLTRVCQELPLCEQFQSAWLV